MQNRQQAPDNNFSDHDEYAAQQAETDASPASSMEEKRQLDYLLGSGFTWEEAVKLLHQRTHLYENVEMQQRMADNSRMHFARWLYEQGELYEV